jgi:hypothetical protein
VSHDETCRRLEARVGSLEKEFAMLAGAVEKLSKLVKRDVEFLLDQLGVCGKRNTETGSRCSLPAGHKETIHSSGRLPRQGPSHDEPKAP